jgi:hypothetical protein
MTWTAKLWLAAAAVCAASSALGGPAVNQFETKDLESEAGQMQFQSQNAIAFGQPRRAVQQTAPGVFAYDDNTVARERYALEMQMGVTNWFRARVGVEFEKERLDDPGSVARANAFEDLHLAGIALEGVFVLVPVKKQGIGLGLLTEYDHSIRGGANQLYIGPIVQAVSGPWTAIANLLLVQHYGSPDPANLVPADRKRDFAYAAQLQYEVSPTWTLALEGYGTFDRLGHSGTRSPEQAPFGDFDQHRLGPVIYYRFDPDGKAAAPSAKKSAVKSVSKDDDDALGDAKGGGKDDDKDRSVSIGVGMLFGLNGNTPSQTLKLSLEYNF